MGTSAQEVTMEEMEELAAEKKVETAPPKAGATTKLEAEDVPDALRGKTASELIETNRRLEESLRISEDARLALRGRATEIEDVREVVTEDPADKMTREEFEELYKTDPMKAMEIYDRRLTKSIMANIEARFGPLIKGAASGQLEHAKSRYPIEFKLFEKDILKVAEEVNPQVLGTAKGWDDIVRFVRGQDNNIEVFVAAKQGKTKEGAREVEVAAAGHTAKGGAGAGARANEDTQGLDEVERKIALNQFSNLPPEKAYAEYKKWRGVTE